MKATINKHPSFGSTLVWIGGDGVLCSQRIIYVGAYRRNTAIVHEGRPHIISVFGTAISVSRVEGDGKYTELRIYDGPYCCKCDRYVQVGDSLYGLAIYGDSYSLEYLFPFLHTDQIYADRGDLYVVHTTNMWNGKFSTRVSSSNVYFTTIYMDAPGALDPKLVRVADIRDGKLLMIGGAEGHLVIYDAHRNFLQWGTRIYGGYVINALFMSESVILAFYERNLQCMAVMINICDETMYIVGEYDI